MRIAEPTSILELIEPPKGYAFHAGIWLTHDLDWSALCNLVAPALTNVTTTGDRRMHDVRAGVDADAPGLVVLHAGGKHFSGGPALPWACEIPVPGRRQHAKAALLVYRSPSGKKDAEAYSWRWSHGAGEAGGTRRQRGQSGASDLRGK